MFYFIIVIFLYYQQNAFKYMCCLLFISITFHHTVMFLSSITLILSAVFIIYKHFSITLKKKSTRLKLNVHFSFNINISKDLCDFHLNVILIISFIIL